MIVNVEVEGTSYGSYWGKFENNGEFISIECEDLDELNNYILEELGDNFSEENGDEIKYTTKE